MNFFHPSLVGKHALVTGGATGIGYAIAEGLLAQGVKVTIAGRSLSTLQAAVQDLHELGQINYVVLDVTDAQSVQDAFGQAAQHFDVIDILVNNAGQTSSAPFQKIDAATWQQMLAVNLTGTFNCMQQALPDMLQKGWGRIINIASTAGMKAYPYVAAYCAAKHGVIGLTRALALEVATKGVTVNAVCPGYTETNIVKQAVANIVEKTGRTEEQAIAVLAGGNPQKRLIHPEEVADAVLWLCSPTSGSQNGQSIAIAGGEVM
jgi:3-hydroxybutyrate dehydrogenase